MALKTEKKPGKVAILWRQRKIRHVVTSEKNPPYCDVEKDPPYCDVRERSTILWRQRTPCCDVIEKAAMLCFAALSAPFQSNSSCDNQFQILQFCFPIRWKWDRYFLPPVIFSIIAALAQEVNIEQESLRKGMTDRRYDHEARLSFKFGCTSEYRFQIENLPILISTACNHRSTNGKLLDLLNSIRLII